MNDPREYWGSDLAKWSPEDSGGHRYLEVVGLPTDACGLFSFGPDYNGPKTSSGFILGGDYLDTIITIDADSRIYWSTTSSPPELMNSSVEMFGLFLVGYDALWRARESTRADVAALEAEMRRIDPAAMAGHYWPEVLESYMLMADLIEDEAVDEIDD